MRQLQWIAVCLIACVASGLSLAAEPSPHSILVLDQANVRGPFYYAVFSALRSTVEAGRGPVTIYAESLDLSRFGGTDYEESLEAHLRVKYRDRPVDVIVAIGSATLDFALRNRAALWPGIPVVFGMVDEPTALRLKPPPDVTGHVMKLRFEDMLTTARAVVPGLERVALVGDTLTNESVWRYFIDEIPDVAANVEIMDFMGWPMRELRKRLGTLPDRTAILYTGIYSDGEGAYFPPADALALLAPLANRPIVITAETFLDRGGIGGFVIIPSAIGQETAQLALRILDGEPAASIPITMGDVVRPIFDWRQLQRWGVSESHLPPGSEIRFRDMSVWERYREAVMAAFVAVLLQTAIISWLLYERWQRRRSEAAAHELSGRMINAAEEERARLGRELHDDVTQRLALLAIDAGREEQRSSASSAGAAMRTMREGLVRLSEDVHALSYRLHPSILDDLGLAEALKSECGRFARTFPIRLQMDDRDIPETLPRDVALCMFRIAQEALRNVGRHARARQARVSLQRFDGGLKLAVGDDGAGFDPARHRNGASLGLASMRQRAFLVGGKVDITSSPGRGTTITAWVPLREHPRESSARTVG